MVVKSCRDDKMEILVSLMRKRSVQVTFFIGVCYLCLVGFEIPFVFTTDLSSLSSSSEGLARPRELLDSKEDLHVKRAPSRPLKNWVLTESESGSGSPTPTRPGKSTVVTESKGRNLLLSGLSFDSGSFESGKDESGIVELHKTARTAYNVGKKLWREVIDSGKKVELGLGKPENVSESCVHSISLSGSDFIGNGSVMILPCGLTLGSHVTVVGKPKRAHSEGDSDIALVREGEETLVSQFKVELQGLKIVEGEDPPRILHFNPRLKGDWSGKPVIEQNTCYRMQWGSALRCEGWKSRADEETG